MEIVRWLSILIPKVEVFRGITIVDKKPGAKNTFVLMIENELVNDLSFDEHKRKLAELWLLRGDWTYKKRYFLELSDFYPTEKQIESLLNPSMILLTREEFALKIRKAKEAAVRDYEAELDRQPKKPLTEQEQALLDRWFELGKERMNKTLETIALKRDIQRKELRIMELQEEVRNLRMSEDEKMNKLIDDKNRIMKKIKTEMKKTDAHGGTQSISAILKKYKKEIQP